MALGLAASASYLTGTAQAGTPLTWNVAGDGAWDTTTANWTMDGTNPATFASDGLEDAIFTAGTAGHTITISSDMTPASISVSGGYTFSGGPIAGSGSITKNGSGTLKIDGLLPNTYSGGTFIDGGVLHCGTMVGGISPGLSGVLGTGPVTLGLGTTIEFDNVTSANALISNGGTFASVNGWGTTWNGPVTLDADMTVDTTNGNAGGVSFGDAVSGVGGLTITGHATVVLSGANSYTGKTIVNSGTLRFSGSAYLSDDGLPGVFGAPTGPAAIIDLHNGAALRSDGSNPRVNQSTNRPLNLAGSGAGTVSIVYNDNDASLTFGDVTATGTGPKTLAIFTGNNGNGDREAIIFTGAIVDSSDNSPTSLAITFNTQGSPNWVSLSGENTFTGPITLAQINGSANGVLVVGGVRAAVSGNNTVGTGTLNHGNFLGAISLGARTVLEYDSTTPQILAGQISGPGSLQVTASGQLTITGPNTYSGNTTVASGSSLVLDTAAALTFKPTDSSTCNKLTGQGAANLNGHFAIDTSGLGTGVATGSWTVVDVANPVYGGTFSVEGFTGPGPVWTKVAGAQTWTFNQTSGVLSLSAAGLITSFNDLTYNGVIDQSALTIHMSVPVGTDLTTLAPTYTVSSGTGDPASGTARDFTTAKTYTVTDGATANTYTVTISFFAGLSESTYLGPNGQSLLAPISNLMALTPSATGHQVDTIDYHGSGFAALPGSPGPDNFSILWEGWFDVLAAGGHGDYTFGTSSDDGSVVYMDLNGNGSFADPGEYIVNNNYSQANTVRMGTVTLNMDSVHLVIGYYEGGGGYDMTARYAKGTAVAWNSLNPINGTAGLFFPTDPHPAVAHILSFGIPGHAGVIESGDAKTITLIVPPCTDLATVAPTFTLSSGTCDQTSGAPPSPTFGLLNPAIYQVTDGATVNNYIVTVTQAGFWTNILSSALDLSAVPEGSGDTILSLAQGSLPAGSILTEVSVDGTVTAGDPYTGDMCVIFSDNGGSSFALRVGDGGDNGIPDATTVVNWGAGGDYGVGQRLVASKTVLDGIPANFDLHNYAVYLTQGSGGSDWGGAYSGTITIKYAQTVYPKEIQTFSFPTFGPATISGTNITMAVLPGTDLTQLSPTYTVCGESCLPASGSQQDFTNPVHYVVKATDGSTQDYTVTVTGAGSTGYSSWAQQHAGGQTAEKDYNHDGVQNGIAYFMGATGKATLPGIVNGQIAWPHDAGATGITWQVMTSQDLQNWTDVTAGAVDAGGFVTYILPKTTPERFIRLEVVAP